MSDPASLIDKATLRQLAEDIAADDLDVVISTFTADIQRLSAALRASARAADLAAYHRTAHALAGAAGVVGAIQLEADARTAMTATVPDAMFAGSVADVGERTLACLHELLASGRFRQ